MKQQGLNAKKVSKAGIQRLLEDSAIFGEGPQAENIGQVAFTILPSTLSSRAAEFVAACYDENFVQPFDWGEWSNQHEEALTSDAFIAKADLVTIVKMLTTHIRADRFCDGHLLSVMQGGTILRILKRLNEINSEQMPGAYADKPRHSG